MEKRHRKQNIFKKINRQILKRQPLKDNNTRKKSQYEKRQCSEVIMCTTKK